MSETFGAMGNLPADSLFVVAIEQFSKGITDLISHAVWYNDSAVTFLPELSWRNPVYSEVLPEFNTFLARLRYVLARPGRHVADVGVLYPVQTQYAGHYMDGPLSRYDGGVRIEGSNYDQLSAILTDSLGVDFTYIHPDVLNERCSVTRDGRIRMANKVNEESFSVIILPSVRVVDIENLRKVRKAAERGARVIFTTILPEQSSTADASDAEVATLVAEMLESKLAEFVPELSPDSVGAALDCCSLDVQQEGDAPLNYIHKVIDDRDVYFMGNIKTRPSSQTVSLKGRHTDLLSLDPRTGTIEPLESVYENGRTVFSLSLLPAESRIIIEGVSVAN